MQCSELGYTKVKNNYWGAGYTHILSPVNQSMPLEAGKTYLITLHNSNQGAPNNYSAMPQNFFLIENGKKIKSIPEVLPEHYQIGNYDDQQVALADSQHNRDNWNKAKSMLKNNLADQYHLVPTPVSIQSSNEAGFNFSRNSQLSISDEFKNESINKKMLAAYLKQDFHITMVNQASKAAVVIKKIKLDHPEGYKLHVANNTITIEASTSAGVFYAIQTLRQLWSQQSSLQSVSIEDYPRFKYRGVLLDVSRHFFTVKEVEKIIDLMAAQKLNTLHIHFSDDEAWRLDVSQNQMDPLKQLVMTGGMRGYASNSTLQPAVFTQANLDISNREHFSSSGKVLTPDYSKANDRYAGHYTDNDIHALIDYANARQLTLIPEIDLPGHARALIHSMPAVFQDAKDKSRYLSPQGYDDNVIPVCLYEGSTPQSKLFTETTHRIVRRMK
jgi:hexosaminidase